jgi:hypothetical protein
MYPRTRYFPSLVVPGTEPYLRAKEPKIMHLPIIVIAATIILNRI